MKLAASLAALARLRRMAGAEPPTPPPAPRGGAGEAVLAALIEHWVHLSADARQWIASFELFVIAPNASASEFLPGVTPPALSAV